LIAKKPNGGRLVANWKMVIGGEEFYQRNYLKIVNAINTKARGDIIAA
jgi:hypothetical protein